MTGGRGVSVRAAWRDRFARLLASAILLAGGLQGSAAAYNDGQRTVYVQVTDPEGRPAIGLTQADFRISVNGEPVEVLGGQSFSRSHPGAGDSAAGLRLVIYADDQLDTREAFRAQRAALHLAGRLDPTKDSAAVYSRYALSAFTSDPGRLAWMIRLYGEEIDRMGFGRAAPARTEWKLNWPPDLPDPAQAENVLETLRTRGNQGRLTSVLTPLSDLPGRKILLYFGRDIPYQSEELEYHDPRFAARALSDAGFTVFAFNPSGSDDSGMRRLSEWAEATGGAARSVGGDLRPALIEWLQGMNSFYALSFRDPRPLDCRWSELEIEAAVDGLKVAHPAGFFATLDFPADLTDRTLWTVATHARYFNDFPVEVNAGLVNASADSAGPPRPTGVKVTLRFPFSASRDEDTESLPSRSGKFQQRIIIFLGVYDRAGKLLGWFETPALVSRDPEELKGAPEELARIDETIQLDRNETPGSLRAILVIGQNRRIVAEGGSFGADN